MVAKYGRGIIGWFTNLIKQNIYRRDQKKEIRNVDWLVYEKPRTGFLRGVSFLKPDLIY